MACFGGEVAHIHSPLLVQYLGDTYPRNVVSNLFFVSLAFLIPNTFNQIDGDHVPNGKEQDLTGTLIESLQLTSEMATRL